MTNEVVIVDYGMGNVGSIRSMYKYLGIPAVVSRERSIIENASRLIIAGVGAFDAGMRSLKSFDLISLLSDRVQGAKIPVLGICLGMQLFTESSEEGNLPGLGWIKGHTVRFKLPPTHKIPHMGWNTVTIKKSSSLTDSLLKDSRFYFVHSYHCIPENSADVLLATAYCDDFVSGLQSDNIFGVQFHPEKSHTFGMRLLDGFYRLGSRSFEHSSEGNLECSKFA